MLSTKLKVAGISLLALAMSQALAETAPEQDLPEARSLIERYIEAIGGRDAIMAQTEVVMTGELAMPAVGISGSLLVASRMPIEQVIVVELPGMGEMRTGVSPELAWSVDPFMGPRLIEGEEFKALMDNTMPGATMRDPEYVKAATTVGMAEFGGQSCYRVKIEWHSGRESHDCYAVDSGFLIAMESLETSPMGQMEAVSVMEEFREVEGVVIPMVIRQTIMGMEQVMTMHDISFETPDPALFELPPAIQTLLEDQ